MPSKIEGRIYLALQAYTNNHFPSLRATANTYEVLFKNPSQKTLWSPPTVMTCRVTRFTCAKGLWPWRSLDVAHTRVT
jgi:hypothetical protein